MLKIDRSDPPEAFLDTVGSSRENLFEWARRPLGEREQRRAPFNSDLFHQRELRSLISEEFNKKCAYCERPLGDSGDIDHFRPKSLYPWLAFEWVNLLYACKTCNQSKSDKFPLVGRSAPFLSTIDEIRLIEQPLLVDPTSELPGKYLNFLSTGLIAPLRNSRKGKETISSYQLNEPSLIDARKRACEETLTILKDTFEGRSEPPRDFLTKGDFLGSRHWMTARSISSLKKLPVAKVTGSGLEREVQRILTQSSDRDRSTILQSIEDLETSDLNLTETSSGFLGGDVDRTRVQRFRDQLPAEVFKAERWIEPKFTRGNISSVKVSNFKGIEALSIDFLPERKGRAGAPCLLLLGENAVGKSSFLLCLGLALLGSKEVEKLDLPYSSLARSVGRETWDQWGQDRIVVSVEFTGNDQAATFSYDPVSRKLSGSEYQSAAVLGYGPHRYFSATKSKRRKGAAERLRSLFDPLSPLPDPTDWLSSLTGSDFNTVAGTIRTILPIGDNDDLVNDPQFGICVRADGQLTPLSKLSEGYRSVFAMVADICRNLLEHYPKLETARGIVLIDEIDTHLHPRWKLQVMSSLRRALPNVQFVVTSHDPLCLRGMDDGEVVVLHRDETGKVVKLENLPDVTGMRAEQLLTSEYFGLASTVDPDLQLQIARFVEDGVTETKSLLGEETDTLIDRLTAGESSTAQIIHEALVRYLHERERPVGGLKKDARSKAVEAVVEVLKRVRG